MSSDDNIDLFKQITEAPGKVTLTDVCELLSDTRNASLIAWSARSVRIQWEIPAVMFHAIDNKQMLPEILRFLEKRKFPKGCLDLHRSNVCEQYLLVWKLYNDIN